MNENEYEARIENEAEIENKRRQFYQAAEDLYKPIPKELFKAYGVKRGL